MKKIILAAFVFLNASWAFAYTLSEINEAYVSDSPMKMNRGTFAEAMKLLQENKDRGSIIHASNILMKIRLEEKLSLNRRAAVEAALDYATSLLLQRDHKDLSGR